MSASEMEVCSRCGLRIGDAGWKQFATGCNWRDPTSQEKAHIWVTVDQAKDELREIVKATR